MKYLTWLLKAAIFFTLFAFALNNQHEASVNFFFGRAWQAPLVLVVLAAFAAGLALGVLVMMPRWWRGRQAAKASPGTAAAAPAADAARAPAATEADSAAQAPHGV